MGLFSFFGTSCLGSAKDEFNLGPIVFARPFFYLRLYNLEGVSKLSSKTTARGICVSQSLRWVLSELEPGDWQMRVKCGSSVLVSGFGFDGLPSRLFEELFHGGVIEVFPAADS